MYSHFLEGAWFQKKVSFFIMFKPLVEKPVIMSILTGVNSPWMFFAVLAKVHIPPVVYGLNHIPIKKILQSIDLKSTFSIYLK